MISDNNSQRKFSMKEIKIIYQLYDLSYDLYSIRITKNSLGENIKWNPQKIIDVKIEA